MQSLSNLLVCIVVLLSNNNNASTNVLAYDIPIARVHPILMNTDSAPAGYWPQTKPANLGCVSTCRLLPSVHVQNRLMIISIQPKCCENHVTVSQRVEGLSQARHCSKGVQPAPRSGSKGKARGIFAPLPPEIRFLLSVM